MHDHPPATPSYQASSPLPFKFHSRCAVLVAGVSRSADVYREREIPLCSNSNSNTPYPQRLPLPPSCSFKYHSAYSSRCNGHTTEYCYSQQTFFGDLVINEPSQTPGLQIRWLVIEEEVIVSAGLCVIAQFVVSESQIVQAFPPPLRCVSKYLREQANAFLLFTAGGGFDQTLV